ncbi:serine protease 27-like [Clinocottus analis]|uniref:serine protease 27-like n=1 Tax=Clinocottus analis TaxID=304258 RepID=UPI0035C0B6EB
MALYQFVCASIAMMILLSGGCHSQQPACGRAPMNTRIIGGQTASPGSWPWMVSLNSEDRPFCAGSLIHNQWVLTAAHCLTGSDIRTTTVFLGRQSQSGLNFDEVSVTLEKIVRHPSYNSLTNENDICLLKLSVPVAFTDYIQPVCLAAAGSTFHAGVSSWVTGFGNTQADSSSGADMLQELNLPIVGNNECKCTYSFIKDTMICAGFKQGGKDACKGDSGSALVTKKGFMWIQSGIVSFGDGCGQPMTPGVYTRVSEYQDWINNMTGSSNPGFVTYTSSGVDSDLNFTCSTPTMTPTTRAVTSKTTTATPTTRVVTSKTTTATPTTRAVTSKTTTATPTTRAVTSKTTTATPTTTPTTKTKTTACKTHKDLATKTTTMTPATTATPTTTPATANTTKTKTKTTACKTHKDLTTKTTPSTPLSARWPHKDHKSIDSLYASIFDSGVNVMHFSHFTLLCLLVVSLYVLVGET